MKSSVEIWKRWLWRVTLVAALMVSQVGRAGENREALEKEWVASLEQAVKGLQLEYSAGRVAFADVLKAQLKWKKAQRRVASDLSAKISIQKEIVSLIDQAVRIETRQYRSGAASVSQQDVQSVRARLLKERIRLAKYEEKLPQSEK